MTLLAYHINGEIEEKNFRSVTDKDENVNDSFSKDTQDQELPVFSQMCSLKNATLVTQNTLLCPLE